MQTASIRVNVARPMVAVRPAVQARRSMVVRSAPEKAQIDAALKEAEEACAGGDKGECAAAWDTVEELNAAASHAKATGPIDPLEEYCEGNPDADECRVYDD